MSISFDCIVGASRKTTLPSVGDWGTDMNILKDPPKSVYTRKIDKVGDTQEIVNTIEESGDRICENINVYPRGANPAVNVSYSNAGTNGGQVRSFGGDGGVVNSNACNNGCSTGEAYLPYRVMIDGAFRAPLLRQEDRLPLSQQSRVWTSAVSNPEFPNYVQNVKCMDFDDKKIKAINKKILKTNIRPTAVYMEKNNPIIENFEIKNVINNPIKYSVNSNIQKPGNVVIEQTEPIKEINQNYTSAIANTQIGSEITRSDNIKQNIDENKYISEPLNNSASTNISINKNVQMVDKVEYKFKDPHNFSYTTPIEQNKGDIDINNNIELNMKMPLHENRTNIGEDSINKMGNINNNYKFDRNKPLSQFTTNIQDIGDTNQNSGTEYRNLRPSLRKFSFENKGQLPVRCRESIDVKFNNQKSQLNKRVNEQFVNRYVN